MQVQVRKEHKTSYPKPISFEKGEEVQVGKRDAQYPGWIWTITHDGNSGWAPEQLLEIDGTNATARDNYNARELITSVGEILTVRRELNGWYWVCNSAGDFGWVPVNTVIPA
jgi:hypothetical protein